MGGLGLPRLTTYINTRKWCMAQRALIHEDNTAKAVHRLLDRAARYCGSPVVPSQPTEIYSTTSTPAWGSSLGALAGAPSPILVTSSALVPPRHGKRHLLTLQQRGLVTLGDLTHFPLEGPRQWLPLDVQAVILPFPPPVSLRNSAGTGLELLDALSLTGTVFSDCHGLVRKLHHHHVLRRTPAGGPGFPLISACVRRIN